MILSLLMVGLVLAAAAWSASRTGPRLIVALSILAFGSCSLNPLIEAVVFGVMPVSDTPVPLLFHLLISVVLSTAAVLTLKKSKDNQLPELKPRFTPVRLTAVGVVYSLLYLTAGAFVFPYVKDFYATRVLPALPTLIGLQMIRGPLYALYAWPWLKLANRQTPLILGAMYSIVGGVAMLIIEDNPYMPREVRIPHMIEVGVSNFLFGCITAAILSSEKEDESKS